MDPSNACMCTQTIPFVTIETHFIVMKKVPHTEYYEKKHAI